MKKLLLFLITTVLLLNLYQANAQVGIGTDMPNPSTQLEIKSANRGIMIPQVPLTSVTDQTTITAGNLESLLVYNINTSASLTPGYYYWYQGSWNRLLTETDLPDYIVFWDVINGQFTYIDENGDIQIINIADLETLTYLGLNADGHTLEYTDEDGVVTSIDLETVIKNFETVTTIVDNGDGTFTYTDEDGNTTTIDVSNLETLTFLALNPDGKTLEYTDEDGVVTSIDLETVIKNFETVTTIVDNGDGTFTYTDEDGNTTTIDVSNLETLTFLALNPDGKTLEYTDEDGVVTSIDLETVIKNFETVTTIVDNGDGTFTYTDEDGNTTTIDVSNLETLTFLALNPDGKTLEYTDEDGVVTQIDLAQVIKNFETVTTIVDNGDGTFTYTDEDGNTTTIDVSNLETLTFLALNPDGKTLEYTDEDGVVTSIDLETVIKNFETVTTIIDNGDGTFTYTDEDGNTTTIDVSNLETLTFLALNPDGKTLEYTDEDGVVTSINLETVIKNFETVTTIVDNGDGTFTYTDEDGNTTTIDVSDLETLTFLALNPDGKTLEYTDEDGVVTSIDLETVIKNFETVTTIIDNGDGTFTYTDEDGNTTTIDVSNLETLTFLALNPDGKTLEYTDEDGVVTSINLETVIKNFETVTTIVDNGDGTFTYTDEDGNTTTIDVSDLETLTFLALNPDGKTLEYTDEDGVVTSIDLETVIKNFETVTTIVDNGDGTFTYTDEDGNTTVISVGGAETLTTMVLNADGKTLEYKDENGDTTSIDLEAIIDAFETVTTVVVNADGTFTYTDEDGNTTDVDILGFLEVNNGLTKTNNTIQLGGALIKPTTITADATNTLAVAGLQSGSITDNLVVADPATGVLKQVNSAIPKFFYMPAIIFDTSVNGTFTRNLHAEYAAQFQGTGNPLLVSSTGAASSIPTLPATELEYHITYYDTTVFANLSIDANGVLTYDIIGNATEASYMTIVFVVK
ncbi:hypothetical protein Aeqsu_0744 [Aequorivita sublithincola DSM 14238]|uniref:Uncharacterized protein n=1 Tax=Aequorivita sublithincola (strain DSM 14238 / LMG 21431 / ACAM 643 / 9-3) TaxID=746697 RepID=I3YTD3_AEQSU|nr:hypothetical protein [Aequorivita sublithincola]AFL80251.1 hypothetical protein Aeqsu_0744 [Aequorivita sublithincola DSM 14238]